MAECNDGAMRTECADLVRDMAVKIGEQGADLKAILAQTTKTNGHVAELFRKCENHSSRIAVIEMRTKVNETEVEDVADKVDALRLKLATLLGLLAGSGTLGGVLGSLLSKLF